MEYMPSSNQNYNDTMTGFHKVLVKENQAFDNLSHLLSLEREALEKQDIEQIIRYSKQKQELTIQLEAISLERMKQIEQLGLNFNHSQGNFKTPLTEPLNGLWDEILKKVEDCHIKNQINGKIISSNHSSVARSLRLLRSQSRDLGMTYTSKGQTHSRTTSINGIKA